MMKSKYLNQEDKNNILNLNTIIGSNNLKIQSFDKYYHKKKLASSNFLSFNNDIIEKKNNKKIKQDVLPLININNNKSYNLFVRPGNKIEKIYNNKNSFLYRSNKFNCINKNSYKITPLKNEENKIGKNKIKDPLVSDINDKIDDILNNIDNDTIDNVNTKIKNLNLHQNYKCPKNITKEKNRINIDKLGNKTFDNMFYNNTISNFKKRKKNDEINISDEDIDYKEDNNKFMANYTKYGKKFFDYKLNI